MFLNSVSRILLFSAIISIVVLCATAQEQEKKISAGQVPAIIISNFKTAYPNAIIQGYASEKENGKQYYEIESRDGTLHRDVLYNPDGTVAEIEEPIAVNQLPTAVQETFHRQHPRGVITLAEKTMVGDKVTYEVKAREGRKRFSVEFDSSGNILKGKS
jgi:uncharacterized membrane protein YkoI